jgi:hypothetical protein
MYYSRRKIRRGGKKLKTRRRLGGAKPKPKSKKPTKKPKKKPTAKPTFDLEALAKALGIITRKEKMQVEPTRIQPSREKKTIQRLSPSEQPKAPRASRASRAPRAPAPSAPAPSAPAPSAPKTSRKRKMEVDNPRKDAIKTKNYYQVINGILLKISDELKIRDEKKVFTLDEFKNEFFEKLNPNELTDNEFKKSLKELSENDSVSPALISIIKKLNLLKAEDKDKKDKQLEEKQKLFQMLINSIPEEELRIKMSNLGFN